MVDRNLDNVKRIKELEKQLELEEQHSKYMNRVSDVFMNIALFAGMAIGSFFGYIDRIDALRKQEREFTAIYNACNPEVRASDERLYQQIRNWYEEHKMEIPYPL